MAFVVVVYNSFNSSWYLRIWIYSHSFNILNIFQSILFFSSIPFSKCALFRKLNGQRLFVFTQFNWQRWKVLKWYRIEGLNFSQRHTTAVNSMHLRRLVSAVAVFYTNWAEKTHSFDWFFFSKKGKWINNTFHKINFWKKQKWEWFPFMWILRINFSQFFSN